MSIATPKGDPGKDAGGVPRVLAAALVVLAVAALVVFGRVRPAHPGRARDVDAAYCYVAGLAWRRGLDPYDFEQYRAVGRTLGDDPIRCSFAYAPTAAGLVVPFSLLAPARAGRLMVALNVASALAVGWSLATAAGRRLGRGRWRPLALAGVAALAVGAPQSALNLYMGQTTLACLALVCLAFLAAERGRTALGGILLGLATFKVSVPAFVLALVLVERRWKVVAALAVTALLLAAYPLLRDGPVGLTRGWLGAMQLYRTFPQNRPDYVTSFGLAGVLKAYGLPYGWTPLVALVAFAWLAWRRVAADPLERLGVALALPVLFVSGHVYDMAALSPLYVAALLATRHNRPAFAATLGAVALATLPPSIWDRVFPYRGGKELAALVVLAVVVGCVERRAAEARSVAQADDGKA
jgi:hypothetical protein